jgi:hypothetical protein
MRVGIDKSRHHYATTGIHNFCVANIPFDLIARTDSFDLAVVDEHSAITDDPQL